MLLKVHTTSKNNQSPVAQPATKKTNPRGTKVKVTIKLDSNRWQALRIQALREGRSAREIIDALIGPYLKRKGGNGR
jgi:hypothetical protein